jgi:hypothetical protein
MCLRIENRQITNKMQIEIVQINKNCLVMVQSITQFSFLSLIMIINSSYIRKSTIPIKIGVKTSQFAFHYSKFTFFAIFP